MTIVCRVFVFVSLNIHYRPTKTLQQVSELSDRAILVVN